LSIYISVHFTTKAFFRQRDDIETVEKLPKILTFLKFLEKKLSKKHKKGSLNNLESAPKMIDILALGS